MKKYLDNFNAVINATKSQYYQSNNTNVSDADKLIKYAGILSDSEQFQIWDQAYDKDGKVGDNISQDRYFASNNNILFQTESDSKKLTGKVSCYDITTGKMKTITDKSQIFDFLSSMNNSKDNTILTDSNSNKITKENFLKDSKISIKLTKDGFVFTGLDDDLDSRASGDPHYYANNKKSFDFQGKVGNEYLELDSDEMKLISNRGSSSNGATVIVDESIELKGSNITVVAHKGGKYDIHYVDANNKDTIIMNQDGNQIDNAAEILTKAGVSVKIDDKANLSVNYKNRTAKLQLSKSCINDLTEINYGDTGLKSQVAAIYDKQTEKNSDGKITINGSEFFYDEAQQDMVEEKGHSTYDLERKINVSGKSTTVRKAILADLAKLDTDGTIDGWLTNIDRSKKRISLASAFNSSSGYTAAEFDELIGELLYSSDSKYF